MYNILLYIVFLFLGKLLFQYVINKINWLKTTNHVQLGIDCILIGISIGISRLPVVRTSIYFVVIISLIYFLIIALICKVVLYIMKKYTKKIQKDVYSKIGENCIIANKKRSIKSKVEDNLGNDKDLQFYKVHKLNNWHYPKDLGLFPSNEESIFKLYLNKYLDNNTTCKIILRILRFFNKV